MIRTVIEVEGKDDYEFDRQLKVALDKLGFEPKKSEEHVAYMRDMWAALEAEKINPHEITKAFRAKHNERYTQ